MKSQKNELLLVFGWILLWVLPWGKWFVFDGSYFLIIFSDMFRLVIAFGLFVVPGALLFFIIASQERTYSVSFGVFPIGFTLSTLLIGIVGLIGRLLGFSFELVKYTFAFIGLVEILILVKTRPDFFQQKINLLDRIRNSSKNFPLLAALLIGNLMLFNDSLFFIDDSAYLAYLTNWQQSGSLNFNEVIYGLNQVDTARFWFALYPMAQALLSTLSEVPGILLLSNYLEFILVSMAILSLYFFAQILGMSKRAAGFSCLAHIALLCWLVGGELNSVGMWFFQSMSEDKVSAVYIFAPVLFSFNIIYLKEPAFRTFLLLFLAGLSIVFMHPVILFFSGCIVFGLTTVSYLIRELSWKNLVKVVIVIVVWVSPYIIIRFMDHPSTNDIPYNAMQAEETTNIHRFLNLRDDGLYSVPTHILKFADMQIDSAQSSVYQMFLSLPLIILLGAGLIGLRKIKKGYVYSYLFVSIGLISLAMIPYTGWLLGYFVSARMLNRGLWFAPLGIALTIIVKTGLEFIQLKSGKDTKSRSRSDRILQGIYSRIPLWGLTFLLIFGLASPTMIDVLRSAPNLVNYLNFHRQLGQVGTYISDNNSEHVVMITLNGTDDYIPGISSRSKPVSFRDRDATKGHTFNYVFTSQELDDRKRDSEIIRSLDPEIPFDIRETIINQYEVRYILADTQQVDLYLEIMNQNGKLMEIVYQTEDFTLLQVNRADN